MNKNATKTNNRKNATATANTTATANNAKIDTILSVTDLKSLFIECNIVPKFTDSVHYVGCGTRANTFSVNALKTQYNVYCDDENYKLFDTSLFTDCNFTANGNATDKTRPNTIIVKSTDTLKKLLSIVLEHNAKIALTATATK